MLKFHKRMWFMCSVLKPQNLRRVAEKSSAQKLEYFLNSVPETEFLRVWISGPESLKNEKHIKKGTKGHTFNSRFGAFWIQSWDLSELWVWIWAQITETREKRKLVGRIEWWEIVGVFALGHIYVVPCLGITLAFAHYNNNTLRW